MQNVTFNSCSHFTIIFTIVVPLAELSLSNVADFCFYIQILDSCCSFDSDIIFFFPKLIIFIAFSLNTFKNGLFQDCSWIEGDGGGGVEKRPPLPQIYHTNDETCCYTLPKTIYVIPYLAQKIYKLRNETLEFCWHQHFFTGTQQFLLYQEYRYRSNFNT